VPVSRLPRWAGLAGTAVGIAVTAVLVVAGPLRLPARVERAGGQDDFLAAWERSRRGTFVVRSTFERRQPDGAVLSSPTELVQRPPDRLLRRFGGVSGEIGGRPVTCTSDTGDVHCAPAADGGAGSYDEGVRRELDEFRDWFRPPAPGARPRYRVVRDADAGCFDLVLAVANAEAPYGTDARLCFDGPTGALASVERRFDNGIIESEKAASIGTAVTAADLAVPVDADAEPDAGPDAPR
jgi:hypothetical protein